MTKQPRLSWAALFGSAAMFASQLAVAATPTSGNAVESTRTGSPIINLVAAGPSTVNSAAFGGLGKNLTCFYNGTALTGTPANVMSIQGLVPGTTTWYTIASTASIATSIIVPLSVGMAFPNTTPATAVQQVVPATVRVQVVLAGGGSTTTATVNCTLSE